MLSTSYHYCYLLSSYYGCFHVHATTENSKKNDERAMVSIHEMRQKAKQKLAKHDDSSSLFLLAGFLLGGAAASAHQHQRRSSSSSSSSVAVS